MVIARQLINDDWWWTFWTGSDYGFSGSAAFSVLPARSPEGGPIYVLDEYPHDLTEARKMEVKTFARGHYKALIKMPLRYEQPQRTVAMYLGQDSWAERGDTHTLADLANEELEKYDLAFQQARNDRAGGAQLVYTMLQTGELVIADTCQNVIRAIESRVHDKKEPLKVEKAVGDPYDDVWDALRYGVYSHHEPEKKPLEMRVQDRLSVLVKGDEARGIPPNPTQAAVEYMKILREESQQDGPRYYGGVGLRRRVRQMQRRSMRLPL